MSTDAPFYLVNGQKVAAPPLAPALYLVATPIGNLRDITLRALETLSACDVLACEDTRMTRRLLERYGITRKPVAYHEHNAEFAGPKLIAALASGQSVALVCDAGTPLISDPGYRIGVEAREAGFEVIAIPGASAVLTALAASGLPTDDFRFCGFLPAKENARRTRLQELVGQPTTLILFEAPGRLTKTLAAIADIFGADHLVCVARELTKRFETIRTGAVGDILDQFASETIKGEIVILIGPTGNTAIMSSEQDLDAILTDLAKSMPASKAAKEAAQITGLSKAELYARLLTMKADEQ